MGINVVATLPPECRIGDVAHVAGILLGNKFTKKALSENSYYVFVDGVSVRANTPSNPTLADMVITLNPKNPAAASIIRSDGNPYHFDYFFEFDKTGERGLYPKSTAAKIALCVGIVQCFGGKVDFNDCDTKSVNYRAKPFKYTGAQDGDEWNRLQDRIMAVKPLTNQDMEKYIPWAAYGWAE